MGFVVAVGCLTWLISARLTPIFESTVTVDIDRQSPQNVLGQDATRGTTTDADQFLATQVKLVQSDSVLRPVAQVLDLKKPLDDDPVVLDDLRVARPSNTYLIQIAYRSADPQLAADAANQIARSYLEHTYRIRLEGSANMTEFMERQLDQLKAKMDRSSEALAALDRDMNVINPEERTNILASRLMQLNADYASAQGERLRRQAAYESVKDGSREAVLATPQGDALRRLAEHVNQAREEFAAIKVKWGPNSADFKTAETKLNAAQTAFDQTRGDVVKRVEADFHEGERREAMAREAVAAAKDEFDHVNARSIQYQAKRREADADKALYAELVRKIKEAGINASFQNSAIRIADPARPSHRRVSPDIPFNVGLAVFFAAVVAVSAALLADSLDKTVRDPEQVARTLGAEVVGSLPLMKAGPPTRLIEGATAPTDTVADPAGFGESIRTLRSSILLGGLGARYGSLLVTSASPGEGKTTTAVNLACAHAQHGKRTLLIDGDLRRPSVHRSFGLRPSLGLSDVLDGRAAWADVLITPSGSENLIVLPAGAASQRAPELVARGLARIVEEAASEFDLVILDAPPLLGFAEPLEMAVLVDGVVVVAKAGQTSRKAVGSVLATLGRVRAKTVGVVLNEVHRELSDSYSYHGYYRSYYRSAEGGAA